MCGIFGVIAKEEKYNKKELIKILVDVAKLSQVRGMIWRGEDRSRISEFSVKNQ